MTARSVISVLIVLAAFFTAAGTQGQQSVNLTGRWSANDGGTYYLRQLGNELWWYGQSGDGGQTWSNVYQGTIRGEQISGRWADVPHGRVQSSGVMDLVINNPNQLTATTRTGGFGGSVWTRQGAVAVAPPAPGVGAGGAGYVGCFKDQGDPTGTAGRDLSGASRQDGRMTTQMCVSECRAKGFAYAGTQYSTWCFCGNSYGKSGVANNCDMPCGGNPGEKCGGAWANSVYQLAAAVAPQPTGGGAIQVIAGTYGANCGQPRGNKTPHLASACNGRDACEYAVSYQVIGDPAVGCQKNYVAEWQCGGNSRILQASAGPEAGYGSKIMLTCRN